MVIGVQAIIIIIIITQGFVQSQSIEYRPVYFCPDNIPKMCRKAKQLSSELMIK